MIPKKISFIKSPKHETTLQAYRYLTEIHKDHAPEEADVFVVLGGDGTMLHALHDYITYNKPFFGMNLGTVGFLMNTFQLDGLQQRLHKALSNVIRPLVMEGNCAKGDPFKSYAFNEVSLLRQTHQAAKMRLWVDGVERLGELISDGILLSTAAGSTAYNLSNRGPILPIHSGLLALTPISPFKPRSWQSTLLKQDTEVMIDIFSPESRPVSATADFNETRNIKRVLIRQAKQADATLLFDPDGSLEERVLQEQFRTQH